MLYIEINASSLKGLLKQGLPKVLLTVINYLLIFGL